MPVRVIVSIDPAVSDTPSSSLTGIIVATSGLDERGYVLADLSGQPSKPLPRLKDRKFTEIDRDNFDQVMAKQEPRITFKVDNKLTAEGGRMGLELKFSKMDDFQPDNVARQVAPLNQLLELRAKLSNLRSSLYGNDKLESLLQQAIAETETARRGSEKPEGSDASGKEPK